MLLLGPVLAAWSITHWSHCGSSRQGGLSGRAWRVLAQLAACSLGVSAVLLCCHSNSGWCSLSLLKQCVCVLLLLRRFIACYAQVVNTYVFWGTWSALVLMYWEVRDSLG